MYEKSKAYKAVHTGAHTLTLERTIKYVPVFGHVKKPGSNSRKCWSHMVPWVEMGFMGCGRTADGLQAINVYTFLYVLIFLINITLPIQKLNLKIRIYQITLNCQCIKCIKCQCYLSWSVVCFYCLPTAVIV